MGKAIGIDLGTTNTVAAIMEGSRPRVIQMSDHENCVRSAVYISPSGEPMAGSKSFDRAQNEPDSVVISVKRLIGRQFDDPEVQKASKNYQYRLQKNSDGTDVVVLLRDKNYTPTELSAIILKKVKKDAEQRLGEEITHAVITVPAYFNPVQKEQTRIAGEMAGFRVKKVIAEPTAAAIAHNLDQEDTDEPRRVLVYDLGGGTFDISCLLSQSGYHEELDIEGNMWLGGDDFDRKIVDYCVEQIKAQHGADPSQDKGFMFTLRRLAEAAKKELGELTSTEILYTWSNGKGKTVDGCISITRSQFEDMIKDYIDRSVKLMEKALKVAELTPDQIDTVLLVGGSTAIPLVRKALVERFGEDKISQNIDAMTCVAVGAAKLARDQLGITCLNCDFLNPLEATKCENEDCGEKLVPEIKCPICGTGNELDATVCQSCNHEFKLEDVFNVTPKAIGIEVEGNRYEVIMPKNSPYPSTTPYVKQFFTASAAQNAVYIPVYEGECSDNVDENEYLGAGEVPLGEHVPKETPVDVSISLTRDGILHCEARIHYGNSQPFKFIINPKGMKKKRQPGDGDGTWQRDCLLYYFFNLGSIVLDRYAWLVPSDELDDLRTIVNDLDKADDDDDERAGRAAAEKAKPWVEAHVVAWGLARAEFWSRDNTISPQLQSELASAINAFCSETGGKGDLQARFNNVNRLVDKAFEELEKKGFGDMRDETKLKTKV